MEQIDFSEDIFISKKFVEILRTIPKNTKAIFGKMNFHQMVEHMALSMRQANGNILFINLQTPEETSKMYRFMMSNKPFRDNTPNSYLPADPLPIKFDNIELSFAELEHEIKHFNKVFSENPGKRIMNPFFGDLNYSEWCHLLRKHMLHHLRQFGYDLTLPNEK